MTRWTKDSQPVVLLVEDDEHLAVGARAQLERVGCRCVWAPDLRTARRRILLDPPDVILSDYNLPDGTAEDLLEALSAETGAPPVVLCTAASGDRIERLGRHPLVRRVLQKPVAAAVLLQSVTDSAPAARQPGPRPRPLVGIPERRQLLGEPP